MSKEINFNNIRVVLVNTSHPGNIGACARAMKNMGLNNLTLVQPEQFPSGVAVGRAVSAIDILDKALVVNSLQDAVKDCGLVIGASAGLGYALATASVEGGLAAPRGPRRFRSAAIVVTVTV